MIFLLPASVVDAAEWKAEPTINIKTQYNDNVRMRPDENNPESSTGFTFEPRIKFAGVERQIWDMSVDARGKITRFQDIEDADSENKFFIVNAGRQTERTDWRLNTSYEDNSSFDTDFDTKGPDAGLLDDHTQRKTASISPSVSWSMSETSRLSFSINSTNVKYEEVTNFNYNDYENNSVQLNAAWLLVQNHQIGFTASYSEYDSSDADFSYDQTVLQMDYTYTINATSSFGFSFGGRRLDSLASNVTVACEAGGNVFDISQVSTTGSCPSTIFVFPVTPILEDIEAENDGTVTSLTYTSKAETTSHSFSSARTVQPSSFGAAQEVYNATYQFSIRNTERFSTALILDASKTETLSGVAGSDIYDNVRYRFEPSISYKLNENWNLSVLYRYFNTERKNLDEESVSNAIYVNLYLHWPRLTTTY